MLRDVLFEDVEAFWGGSAKGRCAYASGIEGWGPQTPTTPEGLQLGAPGPVAFGVGGGLGTRITIIIVNIQRNGA